VIPGKKYGPEDVLSILWRRKWLIVLPTLLVGAAVYAYTRTLPNKYRSDTLVMIQPQRVREDLIRSTSVENPAERIQTMTQQIMSRTRLEAIITDLDLYAPERRIGLMEDVVERMRNDVSVTVVRGDAFRISYVSGSPVTAMKVTERLARLFIDENLRDREMMAQGTSQFLNSQLEDARRRLIEQEKKLEAYQRRHSGELPSQQDSNLMALSNLQLQTQSLMDAIARDRDKLRLVDQQLAELRSPGVEGDSVVDTGSGTVTGGSTEQQLNAARVALSRLELRLKPEHPDVTRMKRVIRDLEKRAESEALDAPMTTEPRRARTPAELARQQQVRALEREAEELRMTLAAKESEEKRLRSMASTYQSRADAAPTRATELVELTRDYDTLRDLYTSLLAKNEESKLSLNLESRQIGEQFRILDPARVPERPFSPNRLQLNALGVAFGLAVGLGCVFLLEWRDTTLKSDGDVRLATGLPVLAFVPMLMTRSDHQRAMRRRWLLGAATAVLLVVGGTVAAFLLFKA
jgi:polysaccharide chain length determinant protein (PEP-CTERM system associated)